MLAYVPQYGRDGTHSECVMPGSDASPHSRARQEREQGHPPIGPGGASYRQQAIPHEMEPDHSGTLRIFREVTEHRIAQLILQGLKIVGFGEDRTAESACRIPAFRGFLDYKDDLVHVMTS